MKNKKETGTILNESIGVATPGGATDIGLLQWITMLGMKDTDMKFTSALSTVGVKDVCKLRGSDISVFVPLQNSGIGIELMDETIVKKASTKKPGESMVFISVEASIENFKCGTPHLYKGTLPFLLKAGMQRDEVIQLLGVSDKMYKDIPSDVWYKDGLELCVGFDDKSLRISYIQINLLK